MSEPLLSARCDCLVTARSSIVHRDDSRTMPSTHALFRREKIVTPSGEVAMVPIVSGNAWRGILRRIGEQLIAPILDYGGELTPAAGHLLRNGGFLRKSATQMTPEQERELKELVPLIGLFGGAGNGRIMSGTVTVSKLIPVTADTAHLVPIPAEALPEQIPESMHSILGQESVSHTTDLPAAQIDAGDDSPIRLDTETLVAGTTLAGSLRVRFATPAQYALLHDILDTFATDGHLGGRQASGHGHVTATITTTPTQPAATTIEWREQLAAHRDDALDALNTLT